MFRLRRIELYAIREPSADMVTCVTNGAGVVTGLVLGLLVAAALVAVTGLLGDDSSDDPLVQARNVIEDNYFHTAKNLNPASGAHASGMRMEQNGRIVHNTLWCSYTTPSSNPDTG